MEWMTHPNMVTRSRNRNHLTSFRTAAMVSTKGFFVGCSTLQFKILVSKVCTHVWN